MRFVVALWPCFQGALGAQAPEARFDAAYAAFAQAADSVARRAAAVRASDLFLQLPIDGDARQERLPAGLHMLVEADRALVAVELADEQRREGDVDEAVVAWHLVALVRAGRLAEFLAAARSTAVAPVVADVLRREEGRLLPLAEAALRAGDTDHGRAVFERLAELEPPSAVRFGNLALCLRNLGQVELARRAYERALQLAPDDAQLVNDHGLFLRALGEPQRAIDAFRRSYELDAAVPGGRPGLGPAVTNLLHAEALRPGTAGEDPLPLATAALALRPDAAMLRRLVLDVGLDRLVAGPTRTAARAKR